MNPNNRITYRFDRQGKQVPEREDKHPSADSIRKQSPVSKVIPLYQSAAPNHIDEAHPWDSVFQEDVSALEKLIRDSEQPELAPVYRETNDLPEVEREEEDISDILLENDSNSSGVYRRSSKGPSWMQVFLSVAGALATGALFGYLLLNLFTGGFIWPGSAANNAGNQITSGDQEISLDDIVNLPMENAGGEGEQASPASGQGVKEEAVPAASVSIGGTFSYTFLQYGVFSGTETRDEALKQLVDKGLPRSSSKSGDKYPVYAGIAVDQAQAETLAAAMPGLLVYKKDMAITPEKLLFSGSEETANRFFEQSNGLAASWSALIAAQLGQSELSPIGEAASVAWKEKHKAWAETAAEMKKGVTDEKGISYLAELTSAIENGAESMLAYEKQASKENLWKAQTSLMEAVLAQKEWFESMSAL